MSEGEHSADECPPGDRADDAVYRHRGNVGVECLLEAADGSVGPPAEDPVHLDSGAGTPRQVAELELVLHAADGVAAAAQLDLDHQCGPGLWPDDPVDVEVIARLEGADRSLGVGAEDAVDGIVGPQTWSALVIQV